MTIDFNEVPQRFGASTEVVVPFGKYKGQPVEIMRQDHDYVDWLAAQDWFRKRYAALYAMLAAEPAETPEHNRYQAMFLDEAFAAAVYDAVFPEKRKQIAKEQRTYRPPYSDIEKLKGKEERLRWNVYWPENNKDEEAKQRAANERAEKLAEYQAELDAVQEKIAAVDIQIAAEEVRPIDPAELQHLVVTFEVRRGRSGAADVQIELDTDRPRHIGAAHRYEVGIEIKPSMGDDYPAVLRQMQASACNVLYLVAYSGEGATLAQVKKIFATSGITVLMHGDFQ